MHLRVQASLGAGAVGKEESLSSSHVALDAQGGPAEETTSDDP